MSEVRVVTDSTADLGPLAAEEGVAVVALTVSFGDESFEDGVTLDSGVFFERLARSRQRPTTSQPAPGAFDAWMRLLRDYGTMPLSDLIAPALGYAEQGYPAVFRIRDTVMTVAELFRRTRRIVGFLGASSIERLPTETAIIAQVRAFADLRPPTP